jgi:hypothetical protein
MLKGITQFLVIVYNQEPGVLVSFHGVSMSKDPGPEGSALVYP